MALFRKSGAASRSGISPFKAGLIALVLVVVGAYFAYTQANPFSDPYEFQAAFNDINNLAPGSPVRVAGVEVGEVTEIEPMAGGEGATVRMQMEDRGLPLHTDAELKIRPRIFLEGNEFVDVEPGTPSAPELEADGMIPVNQTATPVQLGQVLAVFESDTRQDFQTLLREYASEGLKKGGAAGFRRSIRFWEDAYRNSSLANEALLGTQPGDLFRVLQGQQRTFAALSSEPDQLRGLVTNFNTTAAAFAAEDEALRATIPALRDVLRVGEPALASLNSTFPGVQRFAVDALPGVRSSEVTIPEAFPFVRQLRLLFQPSELRGLARELRGTIPPLARVNRRTIPFLQQNRALSACTNQVLLPFARTPIPSGSPGAEPADSPDADPNAVVGTRDFADPASSGQPFFKQGPRSFLGLAGESRTSDANGKFFRVNFKLDNLTTLFRTGSPTLSGQEPFLLLGQGDERSRPAPPTQNPNPQDGYRKPSFRPDFPCELSVTPDLRAPEAGVTIEDEQVRNILGELGPFTNDLFPALGLDQVLDLAGGVLPLAANEDEIDAQALRRLERSGALEDLDKRTRRALEDLAAESAGGGDAEAGDAGAPEADAGDDGEEDEG